VAKLKKQLRDRCNVTDSGCWEFRCKPSAAGYARTRYGGRSWFVHRLMWKAVYGSLTDGKEIDHLCRNTMCCNPKHLEEVTHRVNMLRGETIAARNGAKTHCVHGHKFADGNTYIRENGGRQCRICRAAAMQRFYARKRHGQT